MTSRAGARWGGHLPLLAAVTVLTGAAWMTVVPPFEGTDELFFYNRAREFAAHPARSESLFYRLAAPIIRAMSPDAAPAAPEYHPAFAFVSNQRGEINRFVHDRPVATREHVRTLMAIRALVVLLAVPTVLMIYASARLATGSDALALVTAGLSLWIPQFSFINAVVHAEAVTRLFAVAITLVVVARAAGALPRAASWLLLMIGIVLVPFADRQALFLAPFAAIGLIATERRLRARLMAATVIAVPGAIAAWIVINRVESDTDLGRWIDLLWHPLRPFTTADASRGSIPPTLAYYAFEFLPKMFMGFWGWLGQPSILLPGWMYGALAALTLLSVVGCVLRLRRPAPSTPEEQRQQLARRLMAVGIVLMCLPIVYGPALMGLNLWYGRWLFPMIGPISLGLILGAREIVSLARTRPHALAAAIGAAVVVLTIVWLTAPGAALQASMIANHYGDRPRLVDTVSDLLVALAIVAVAVEASAHLPLARLEPFVGPRALCAAIGAANMLLLFGFIRPLYAPLTPDDYAAQISRYVAAGDATRAANLYASAVKSYPQSGTIRGLADATPRLLLGGDSASSRAVLWDRIARGRRLLDRDALLMLAQQAAAGAADVPAHDAGAVAAVIDEAERTPGLQEPAALLRLAMSGALRSGDATVLPIEVAGGQRLHIVMRKGDVILEGLTKYSRGDRGTQLIVYFRPQAEAANRRFWLRAYPIGSFTFLDMEPAIPPVWTQGSLAWMVYDLPAGRFAVNIGLIVGSDFGEPTPLAYVP